MELGAGSIVLRPWREDDAPAVYAACQDPEIQHWIPLVPSPYTRDDALAFVTGAVGLGPHQFAIVEDGHVVGSIGMVVDDHNNSGHIGYRVPPTRAGAASRRALCDGSASTPSTTSACNGSSSSPTPTTAARSTSPKPPGFGGRACCGRICATRTGAAGTRSSTRCCRAS